MYHRMNSNDSKQANIAYFAAKNDISFRKFLTLVDLVTRERNLNLENRSVYVNKDACGEFYKCTLGGGCHECCGSCFRVELFQYSDGWVSNSREEKRRCIH